MGGFFSVVETQTYKQLSTTLRARQLECVWTRRICQPNLTFKKLEDGTLEAELEISNLIEFRIQVYAAVRVDVTARESARVSN